MLTQREVAPYLVRRGLVDAGSIVQGDLVVTNLTRRNRNFKIVRERAPCYLVKQGVSPDGVETVAHEASVYRRFQSPDGGRGMSPYLCRFFGYDPEERALVIEFLRDAWNLREYHDRRRRRFPPAVAAELGRALGTLHRLGWAEENGEGESGGRGSEPPWVLSVHRPQLRMLPHLSSASIQAIRIVQRFPEFCGLLDALRGEWVNEAPVHFDIKWENCLVAGPSRGGKMEVRIIDWELAGPGDPRWDVGSVFHDYLSYWLGSIPITGETPPERFAELARYPLARMQPAIRAFWDAYARRMELDAAASAQWLPRAVRYAAARFIQSVHETLYDSTRLTSNAVCSLQLSLNMLRRPHEAVVQLLGIPLPDGAPA